MYLKAHSLLVNMLVKMLLTNYCIFRFCYMCDLMNDVICSFQGLPAGCTLTWSSKLNLIQERMELTWLKLS